MQRRSIARLVVGIVILAGVFPPERAQATSTFPISLPRAAASADLIVEATLRQFVFRTAAVPKRLRRKGVPPPVFTDLRLQVHQVFKGRLAKPRMEVRLLGGRDAGGVLSATPLRFRVGERMVLLLWRNGSDVFPFVGFHQGLYRFRSSGPDRTMPDLQAPSATPCPSCVPLVLDGRDHLVVGFRDGFVRTLNASRHPALRVFIGPHVDTAPPEPTLETNGVIPAGLALPDELPSPAVFRDALWRALAARGFRRDLPTLGDPEARPPRKLPRRIALGSDDDETQRDEPDDGPDPNPQPDDPIEPGPDRE